MQFEYMLMVFHSSSEKLLRMLWKAKLSGAEGGRTDADVEVPAHETWR